jgi:hypothetical protein
MALKAVICGTNNRIQCRDETTLICMPGNLHFGGLLAFAFRQRHQSQDQQAVIGTSWQTGSRRNLCAGA